ncbi:Ig-like domain-containing protein [Edaphobacter aggregans]|uniref:Ig-like domain-containing protein n=1 Tax=Edaphobacter aggregans TaxID=570835 RepID=UPI0005509843|nr:Ig-like domain-containing protein [Edaphobacter aggregans]
MLARLCVRGLFLLCLGSTLIGCNNSGLDSVQVSPASLSLTVGQTAQLKAMGTFGNAKHLSTQDITGGVTWSSSVPAVATVSSSGMVTAVGAGTTTITASTTAYNGPVNSTADLTVTGSAGGTNGGSGGSILSLTIIPSGIVFGSKGDSGQFLAIGTFSTAPTVRDLTNSVTWFTSEPNKFPVTTNNSGAPGGGTQNGGVVSAYEASVGNVGAVITAKATDTNGSIATATANVGCPLVLPDPTAHPPVPGSCFQNVPQLLTTLTVYNEGLNTTNWLVTAPSATCDPAVPATCTPVLTCGPAAGAGKSVCTATYPLGSTVTLTAPAQTGVRFGGWSSNCYNVAPVTQTGPNTCTVNLLTTDATVGAIFN